jgi:pimeloyl-ACP methyl ester carboxylesterase
VLARTGSFLPAAAAAVLFITACGGGVRDPASARCNAPAVTFGSKTVLGDHTEIPVRFRCNGATIAGTLFEPTGTGRVPAVVYVHGSGEASRWTWDVPWVQQAIEAGIALFSYDKRGVGESEGSCCPGDENHFNLLAADADGAVNALRKRPEIDPARIGFLGTSQAGWVVPLATSRALGRVAFTVLVDAPAVTTGEEHDWSISAGEESDNPPELTKAKLAELTRSLQPHGFDPVPLLAHTTVPGIWLYGALDRSEPAGKSAANLERLHRAQGKNFTVIVFPRAGHGLLDTPPTDPRAMPTLLAWLRKHT